MKLAIVGSGISGLTAAYLLSTEHDVTVFEKVDRVGGHTCTTEVSGDGERHAVDAGFIVYNEPNYPNFTRLLDRLGVATQASEMSFGVRCDRTGIEYAGTNLATLFAQSKRIVQPSYHAFALEILRFHRVARRAVDRGVSGTLGEFLARHRFSAAVIDRHVLPMTAAIWSTDPGRARRAPASFILGFLDHHRLLGATGHLDWRVVTGGSGRYVERLTQPFANRIRTSCGVRSIDRREEGVQLVSSAGTEVFDHVIVATHSDQALRMLTRPTDAEREILAALPYQPNRAILHTQESVLARAPRARASWNYRVPRERGRPVAVTYDMTRLQRLPTRTRFCVSLNLEEEIEDASKLASFDFEHPLFTEGGVAAQARHAEISGVDRIHYCGAYWANGFHEDGVVSALRVCERFGATL